MEKTPPAATLRDGKLKATIWQNEGEKGLYYSTTFSRSYKDKEGNYQDTQSFAASDLLRISELAREAHHQTNGLRQRDYEEQRDADLGVEGAMAQLQKNKAKSKDMDREQ